MESVFRECVAEESGRGRTVLLSSHQLDEVAALCDHVTIIRGGRTVETGPLASLYRLTLVHVVAELAGAAPPGLDRMTGVHELVVDGTHVSCQLEASALDDVLRRVH